MKNSTAAVLMSAPQRGGTRVKQPSPAAYGTEPRQAPGFAVGSSSEIPPVCRVPGVFLPSLAGPSAGTQG